MGCLLLLFVLLFGSAGLAGMTSTVTEPVSVASIALPTPTPTAAITFGAFVVGNSLDANSCIIDVADEFTPSDVLFVGLQLSDLPRGTALFTRLSLDGIPLEDTAEIVAPEDFLGCVWFEFTRDEGFDEGAYRADLFVNGQLQATVEFEITGE